MLRRHVRKILLLLVEVEDGKTVLLRQKSADKVRDIVNFLLDKKLFTKLHYEFGSILALGQYVTLGLGLVGLISKLHALLLSFEGISKREAPKPLPYSAVAAVASSEWNDDDMGEAVEYTEKVSLENHTKALPAKVHQIAPKEGEPLTDTTATSTGANTPVAGEIRSALEPIEAVSRKKKSKKCSAMDDIFGESKKKTKKKKKTKSEIDSIFGM